MNLEEKRKLYKCNQSIGLDEIKTWPEYYQEKKIKEKLKSIEVKELSNEILNAKLGIITGDITSLEIDCIVNAANKSLLGGGGVDGAIHRAAGPMLYDECETLNGCETSQAKITAGYNLPAKYCIHTVGPIGYNHDALKKAYLNCLDLAKENNCRSIAFPCISTGVYGFPNDKASEIVSKLFREYLEINHEKFDRIILCLFMEKDIRLYEKYLSIYFPVSKCSILEEIKTNKKELELESKFEAKESTDDVKECQTSKEEPTFKNSSPINENIDINTQVKVENVSLNVVKTDSLETTQTPTDEVKIPTEGQTNIESVLGESKKKFQTEEITKPGETSKENASIILEVNLRE